MNLDEHKVTDQEAQRKAAIFLQTVYTIVMVLIGTVLAVIGMLGLYEPHIEKISPDRWGTTQYDKNSYLAETVVGLFLLLWGVASAVMAGAMFKENKLNHNISQGLAVGALFTLNVQSFKFIRMSNGHYSKKQQKKIDAKLAQQKADQAAAAEQAKVDAENEQAAM